MSPTKALLLVAAPLIAGISVFIFKTNTLQLFPLNDFSNKPTIKVNEIFEVDSRQLGEVVIANFPIQNIGGADLILDNPRTNCACAGLEIEKDGILSRIESLRVPPGESENLVVRVSVRGRQGVPLTNGIRVRTNDPQKPELNLTVRISMVFAGLHTEPAHLAFGVLTAGKSESRLLIIKDHFPAIRTVASINTHDIKTISIEHIARGNDPGEIGRIKVAILADQPGEQAGSIRIMMSDGTHLEIPVTALIETELTLSPSSVTLPRIANGNPLYEATIACKRRGELPCSLEFHTIPPGICIETISSAANRCLHLIRITCAPIAVERGKTQGKVSIPVIARDAKWSGNALLTINFDPIGP